MNPVKVPAIPDPNQSSESLRQAVQALKEGMEVLSAQVGTRRNAAVTWQDLLDLGLILPTQVPRK